jgi:tRNA nucleotidyltransferase/poly(A) polymerase
MSDNIKSAIKLLKSIEILSLVFKEFPSPELIKKSSEFVQLLILCNEFTKEDIEILMLCYKGESAGEWIEKQEEVKVAILNLFLSMAEYAPYAILEQVFTLFKSTSLFLYTEIFLKALSFYTIAVLKNIQRRTEKTNRMIKELEKQNKGKKDYKKELGKDLFDTEFSLYDLNMIWNIMTYSKTEERIHPKVKDLAVNCLVKISEHSENIAKEYINNAFESIDSNKGYAIRSMKFLILGYKSLKKKWGIKKLFKAKATNPETLNTLINNLKDYREKVKVQDNKQLKNHMLYVTFSLKFI